MNNMNKKREFLVEVTISRPHGSSVDDWDFIGHHFGQVDEPEVYTGASEIADTIVADVTKWLDENPATEASEMSETEKKERLKQMKERYDTERS